MASNDPIIDFGNAPRDLQLLIDRLKLADGIIIKISQDALTAGRNLSSIQLPSDLAQFTAQNQQLTAQIQSQAQALAQLQAQYNALSARQRTNNTLTAEERLARQVANRQAMEGARINSTLAGAYAQLSARHSLAARTLQDLIVRGRTANQTQREYNRELRIAQRDFTELNRRITLADRAIGRFNRNVGNYPGAVAKGIKDLLGAFGLVGGVTAIAAITKDIYEQVKAQESLDLALKQVTGSQDEFARAQSFLMVLSEKFGVEINTLTSAYQKFYVSAVDKLKTKQIEDIFTSVTKAAANLGLTVENQDRVFTALNQMLSKGKVQAEELRQQLGDALPGAIGIMQRAYQRLHPDQKITSLQFEKLMKDGKILASEVLPEFARELESTYNLQNIERVDNLAAAQNRLTNAWKNFIRELNDGQGTVSKFFSQTTVGMGRMLDYLTEALKDPNEAQAEKYAKFRTEAYKEEYDSLSALGDKSKEVALSRQQELQPLFDAQTKEKNALLARNAALKEGAKLRGDGQIWNNEGREEYSQNAKQIKFLNNDLYVLAGRLSAINKIRNEKPKAEADPEELSKKELKAIEDALKAKYDAAKKELELQALKQENILNGEFSTYKEQEKSLERFLDLKMKIIDLDYKEQVRLSKGNSDKIRIAEIDNQMAIIKLTQDGFSKLKTIRKKQNDEYIEELKDVEKFLKDYHEKQDARNEESQDIENNALKSTLDNIDKKIARLKELKKATYEYLSSFGDEFLSNSGFGETFNVFFKQIEDADGKITTMFEQMLKGADTTEKKFAVMFNAIAESAQEAFNFISEASARNFDAEKNRIQMQYDTALTYAGENKEAQEKLAEDLEKKKKDIATREAKAKKKQAMVNIAIDTAQAIIGLWASPGFPAAIPLAVLVGALGITQLAIVASQEIPQYWMGGTHDGGLMMVNDGKGSRYKETVVTPDGNIHKPTGRNVVMDAPKGTQIFTADQWDNEVNNMLSLDRILKVNNIQRSGSGITKQEMKEAFMETIGEQPQYHTSFNEDGITNYFIKKGNITKTNSKRGNSQKTRF